MANGLYTKARQKFLNAEIDWDTHDIRAVLVDTTGSASGTYTANLDTDEFLSAIPSDCRASEVALSGRNITADGAADASDPVFTAVAYYTGAAVNTIVIYKFVTNAADSPLIAHIDTATGLPIVPNGGDITVVFDNGINKIFRI